jgi:hypothetical protein
MIAEFNYTIKGRIDVTIEVDNVHYDQGKLDGLPENCYPPEREVDFGAVLNRHGKESKRLYALIDWSDVEDVFWEKFHNGEIFDEDDRF